LELHAIRINTICGVQAFSAAIGSDGAVFEGPKLAITAGAVVDDYWRAIGVAKKCKYFVVEISRRGGET